MVEYGQCDVDKRTMSGLVETDIQHAERYLHERLVAVIGASPKVAEAGAIRQQQQQPPSGRVVS